MHTTTYHETARREDLDEAAVGKRGPRDDDAGRTRRPQRAVVILGVRYGHVERVVDQRQSSCEQQNTPQVIQTGRIGTIVH